MNNLDIEQYPHHFQVLPKRFFRENQIYLIVVSSSKNRISLLLSEIDHHMDMANNRFPFPHHTQNLTLFETIIINIVIYMYIS